MTDPLLAASAGDIVVWVLWVVIAAAVLLTAVAVVSYHDPFYSAMALIGKPALLLLDEPTSGLDPLGIRDARTWIQRARDDGAAVLLCSHVLSEIERTCDRVAILQGGTLAANGPIGELVREGESLEDAFVRLVRG